MRHVLAAVSSVAISLTLLSAPSPAAAAAPKVTVLQVNANGAVYGGRASAIDDIIRQINRKPDVAIIQELCQNQFAKIVSTYGADKVRGFVFRQNTKCGKGAAKQNAYYALVSRHGFVDNQVEILYDVGNGTGGVSRGALCSTVNKGPGNYFVACATKFDSGSKNERVRAKQAAQLKAGISGTYPSSPLVVGADFNALPGSAVMNKVYRVARNGEYSDPKGKRGLFWEGDQRDRSYFRGAGPGIRCQTACRTGQRTHNTAAPGGGQKFDYVGFRYNFYERNSLDLTVIQRDNQAKGKHAMLWSTAKPLY